MLDKGNLRGNGCAPSFSFINLTSSRVPLSDSDFGREWLLWVGSRHASRVLCHSSSPRLRNASWWQTDDNLSSSSSSSSFLGQYQCSACSSHTKKFSVCVWESTSTTILSVHLYATIIFSPTRQDGNGHWQSQLVDVPSISVLASSSSDRALSFCCCCWELFVFRRKMPRHRAIRGMLHAWRSRRITDRLKHWEHEGMTLWWVSCEIRCIPCENTAWFVGEFLMYHVRSTLKHCFPLYWLTSHDVTFVLSVPTIVSSGRKQLKVETCKIVLYSLHYSLAGQGQKSWH